MPVEFDLDSLIQSSIYKFNDIVEVKNAVLELSNIFVHERDNLADYTSIEKLVGAYNCFYMPTNFKKFAFFNSLISNELKAQIQDAIFIDWGCGPGTFMWASLMEHATSHLVGIERSDLMIKQAEANYQQLFKSEKTKVNFIKNATEFKSIKTDLKKKFLCFGNSVNEVGENLIIKTIETIDPDFILFIGLGTPTEFKKMLSIKDLLNKYEIKYPCLDSKKSCPLKTDSSNWCHQVFKTTFDPSIEQLSQMCKLDRRVMPLILHFYQKTENAPTTTINSEARVLRILKETKFSFIFEVCNSDHKIIRLEAMKKDLSKKQIKAFDKLSFGEKFQYETVKEIESDYFRIKIQL